MITSTLWASRFEQWNHYRHFESSNSVLSAFKSTKSSVFASCFSGILLKKPEKAFLTKFQSDWNHFCDRKIKKKESKNFRKHRKIVIEKKQIRKITSSLWLWSKSKKKKPQIDIFFSIFFVFRFIFQFFVFFFARRSNLVISSDLIRKLNSKRNQTLFVKKFFFF